MVPQGKSSLCDSRDSWNSRDSRDQRSNGLPFAFLLMTLRMVQGLLFAHASSEAGHSLRWAVKRRAKGKHDRSLPHVILLCKRWIKPGAEVATPREIRFKSRKPACSKLTDHPTVESCLRLVDELR